jgi:drug/metabolite transporter (DMT)-like permease
MVLRHRTPSPRSGAVLVICSAFFVTCFGLAVRLVSPMFGPVSQVAFRSGIAALIPLLCNRGKGSLKLTYHATWGVIVIGSGTSLSIFCLTQSALQTTLGSTALWLYTSQIAVTWGVNKFSKTPSRARSLPGTIRLAITMVVIGLIWFSGIWSTSTFNVSAWAVVAGSSNAVVNLCRARIVGGSKDAVLFWQCVTGCAVACLAVVLTGHRWLLNISWWPAVAMVGYGVITYGMSALLFRAYNTLGYDRVEGAALSANQVVFGTILDAAWSQEVPTGHQIGGCLLIIGATVRLLFRRNPQRREATETAC